MKFSTSLKRYRFSQSGIIGLSAVVIVILLVVGGAVLATHHTKNKPSSANVAEISAQSATTHNSDSSGTNTLNATGSTTDADRQTANDAASSPITDACKLLTLAVAKQLLGDTAAASTPSDASSLQTADTSLSGCAYRSGNGTVQLVIRTPTSSVGKSENATEFGSNKPLSAINISGYGQSAYWDPVKDTLNVLGNNNWYVITREPGSTQADAEMVAASLKSGF